MLPSETAILIPHFPMYCIDKEGNAWSKHNGKWGESDEWVKLKTEGQRYARISLSVDGVITHFSVHRLMLELFVGPCPPEMVGCHNDGNSLNNVISNLRWDYPWNNEADKKIHGTLKFGTKNGMCRLNDKDILDIREKCLIYNMERKWVAKFYKIHPDTVNNIIRYKTHQEEGLCSL